MRSSLLAGAEMMTFLGPLAKPDSEFDSQAYLQQQSGAWRFEWRIIEEEDPLRALGSQGNPEKDRRRERRALTPDELAPDYVRYVERRLLAIDEPKAKPRLESQDPALFERR